MEIVTIIYDYFHSIKISMYKYGNVFTNQKNKSILYLEKKGNCKEEKLIKIKLIKKITSLALIISILGMPLSTTVQANAFTDVKDNNEIKMSDFESMTNEELNQYIDNVMLSYQNNNVSDGITTNGVTVPQGSLEGAWYAAAQVAKNMGYVCAGTLVEYSVNGYSYTENSLTTGNGLFAKKILAASEYNQYFWSNISGKTSTSGSFAFKTGDLFFALHNVSIQSTATLPGTIYTTYAITITDTFDFALDNNYDSFFSTAINNWGWLSQQVGALKKIPVKISFIVS